MYQLQRDVFLTHRQQSNNVPSSNCDIRLKSTLRSKPEGQSWYERYHNAIRAAVGAQVRCDRAQYCIAVAGFYSLGLGCHLEDMDVEDNPETVTKRVI
jgi:hypothetical protein